MDPLSLLDSPAVTQVLFHPRRQSDFPPPEGARDLSFQAYDGARLGGRLYAGAGLAAPNILFFHGNGEIAEDYDVLGPIVNARGMNFLVMDYRGYGISEGAPSVTALVADAHAAFGETLRFLGREGAGGPLWVMGRSLGSAAAIEIAANREDDLAGLIVESGFAHTIPLLRTLGVPVFRLGLSGDEDPLSPLSKMARFRKPTLVIHAEYDSLIPLPHGEDLFEAAAAVEKRLYIVKNADHNNILIVDPEGYISALADFVTGPAAHRTETRKELLP